MNMDTYSVSSVKDTDVSANFLMRKVVMPILFLEIFILSLVLYLLE